MATGYTSGDPSKLPKAGGTMTGALVLSGPPTAPLHPATKAYVDAAPSSGVALKIADSGFITTGDITVLPGAFTQLGPDLTVAAAAGNVLELTPDVLVASAGVDLQLEAATRVAAADNRYWSSNTAVSRFPGGVSCWYIGSGYGSPGVTRYVVQASDVVAGAVTVRFYARLPGSSRVVFANANYPLRWSLTNLGSG